MIDQFSTTLGKGVEQIVAQLEAENKAWAQVASNLAQALEFNGLHGIASLAQQKLAHGLAGGVEVEPLQAVDMHPMATYMDLMDAFQAVKVLHSQLPKDAPIVGLAYTNTEPKALLALAARLRSRAAEFDTRPQFCEDCHTRHTTEEGCFDGRV